MEMTNIFNQNIISFICPIQVQATRGGWSLEEENLFEYALAFFDLNSSDFFEKIADMLPGKTIDQVKFHFDELVRDLKLIETGRVGLPPTHNFKSVTKKKLCGLTTNKDKITSLNHPPVKKGARWTKDEHEKFLVGLNKYGKGDWRSISRNIVLTKTPTQVASHAQKYFIRLAKSSSAATGTSSAVPSLPRKQLKLPPTFQEINTRITPPPTMSTITTTQSSWVTGGHVSDHHLDSAVIIPLNKKQTSP